MASQSLIDSERGSFVEKNEELKEEAGPQPATSQQPSHKSDGSDPSLGPQQEPKAPSHGLPQAGASPVQILQKNSQPAPPVDFIKSSRSDSVDSWFTALEPTSPASPASLASPTTTATTATPATTVSPNTTASPATPATSISISTSSSPSTESSTSAVTEYSDPDEVDDLAELGPAAVAAKGTRELAWLTEGVLTEMLADRPGVRLVGMHAKPIQSATAAAGSALPVTRLSLVHQSVDEAKSRRRRLIVKSLPRPQTDGEGGESDDYQQLSAQLLREAVLYGGLLQALAARAARGSPPLFARCFPVSAPGVLVLADLRARGFAPQPRHRQLGLAHCSAALSALARLHALSLALRNDRPAAFQSLERLPEPQFTPQRRDRLREQIEPLVMELAAQAAAWPGLELLAPKVRAHAAPMADWLVRYSALPGGAFSVLAHGDLWVGNVLFQHGIDGGITEVRFTGFHHARWAPAVTDVLYFAVMCPRPEVRAELGGLPGLLERYRVALATELAAAGQSAEAAPPLERLLQEARHAAPLALFAACVALPAALAEPAGSASPESSPASSDSEAPLLGLASPLAGGRPPPPAFFSSPLVRERLTGLLQELDQLGWL